MTYSGYTLYRTRKRADSFRFVRKSESTLKRPSRGVIFCGYAEQKRYDPLQVKKVNYTLVQALRLRTGRTAHSGSRGIALLFLDHGTRRG